MKREEQITSEAKKHYYDDINCYNAFLHGVECADRNPVNVWHDASVEPQGEDDIVCQDTLGDVWVTNRRACETCWVERAIRECIVRWAYVKDLLPKGGEQ